MIVTDNAKKEALEDKLTALLYAVEEARDAWIAANGTQETWEEWCNQYGLYVAASKEIQP